MQQNRIAAERSGILTPSRTGIRVGFASSGRGRRHKIGLPGGALRARTACPTAVLNYPGQSWRICRSGEPPPGNSRCRDWWLVQPTHCFFTSQSMTAKLARSTHGAANLPGSVTNSHSREVGGFFGEHGDTYLREKDSVWFNWCQLNDTEVSKQHPCRGRKLLVRKVRKTRCFRGQNTLTIAIFRV